MARVLVVGASGQLGMELRRAQVPAAWALFFPERAEMDLASPAQAASALEVLKPDAVINAAAYTAVDRAESEAEFAFAINCHGPEAIARAAAQRGAAFLQVSSDYVFGGDKPFPYVETDAPSPLGVYGQSKAAGERAVLAVHPGVIVVRTSWVYSPHRANFVKTMLRLGEQRAEVSVVDDQVGRPTAAAELAAACIELTRRKLAGDNAAAGVFHYAGAGEASWADFAEAAFAEAEARGRAPVRVRRITTADYPTPARRPANSRLDTTKIERLGIVPRPWREALGAVMDELLSRRSEG